MFFIVLTLIHLAAAGLVYGVDCVLPGFAKLWPLVLLIIWVWLLQPADLPRRY